MNVDTLFSLASNVAFFSWFALLIFPYSISLKKVLLGVVIAALSLLYAVLIFNSFDTGSFESFTSLEGISSLFTNKKALLAGWVHYLAFDLMVGLYITSNAEKLGIKGWVLIPVLLLTFMLGPLGLLAYMIFRTFYTRIYFEEF